MKKFLLLITAVYAFFIVATAQKFDKKNIPKGILYQKKTMPQKEVPVVYPTFQKECIKTDSTVCIEQQWIKDFGKKTFEIKLSEYPDQPWRNILYVQDYVQGKTDSVILGIYNVLTFRIGPDPVNPRVLFSDDKKRLVFLYDCRGKKIQIDLPYENLE